MNTTFYLIRHGALENPKEIVYGRTDIPLSQKGVLQMQALGNDLQKKGVVPDIIIASTMLRAIQSAKELGKFFPKTHIKTDVDFQETDCGKFTGEPMSKLLGYGDFYNNPECLKMGIEEADKVVERMKRALLLAKEQYPGKTVFIISHGDPLAFLMWNLLHPDEPLLPRPQLEHELYLEKGQAWKVILDDQNHVTEYETISTNEAQTSLKERKS